MRRGLLIAGVGAAVGLVAALATNHLLSAMLYDISPTDAVTLGLVTGSLLGVAALASAIPARRAMRVDPMVALRYE
jgi:ABC-type antimicrobial peptide transport system permease subunit